MFTRYRRRLLAGGFTVVEMIMSLAIASILMMVAVAGFTDVIANNRMRTEVYALRAMLMEARSEAMTKREDVSICASKDGKTCSGNWNQGYIAFFDANADGKVDTGERIALSRVAGGTSTITIAYSNANGVLFNGRGNAQTVAKNYNGTFKFCDQRGAKKAAGLIVSRVGNVTAAVDSTSAADGIVNDDGDNNIVCP
jgi:prepilin-type N-terminal cleavage/methylation domain-containing protein